MNRFFLESRGAGQLLAALWALTISGAQLRSQTASGTTDSAAAAVIEDYIKATGGRVALAALKTFDLQQERQQFGTPTRTYRVEDVSRLAGALSAEKVRAFYDELNKIVADDHEQWRAVRKLPPRQ